jgi:hypothetical protein
MKYAIMALFLASLLLSGPLRPTKDEPINMSLIQLLANPERFDRKSVRVWGYLLMEHQPGHSPDATLFFHKEDADNLLGNGVPVGLSERMLRDAEKIDRMYVILAGTVRVTHAENGGSMVGIADIQYCSPWSDPSRPIGLRNEKGQTK